jgi:hypothetical protein
MAPKAMEDWQIIRQNLVAVAEMERLRADSLQLLDQSSLLLRLIDRINSPLISPSSGNEHGFGHNGPTTPANNR